MIDSAKTKPESSKLTGGIDPVETEFPFLTQHARQERDPLEFHRNREAEGFENGRRDINGADHVPDPAVGCTLARKPEDEGDVESGIEEKHGLGGILGATTDPGEDDSAWVLSDAPILAGLPPATSTPTETPEPTPTPTPVPFGLWKFH